MTRRFAGATAGFAMMLLVSVPTFESAAQGEPSAEPGEAATEFLPTKPIREWLGALEGGEALPMADTAQTWMTSLQELARETASLHGTTVALADGVDAEPRVNLVSMGPVGSELALRALRAAATRCGLKVWTDGEPWVLQRADPPAAEPIDSVELMVVQTDGATAKQLEALYRQIGFLGGAAVADASDEGLVVACTYEEMFAGIGTGGASLLPSPTTAPEPEESPVEELAENHFRVPREVVAPLADDATRQARIIPSYSDGEFTGYKLFSIRRGSVFDALQIRNGDVIEGVGKQSMAAAGGLGAFFQALMREAHVEVTLRRRGQEVALTYELTGDPIEATFPEFEMPRPLAELQEEAGIELLEHGPRVPREVLLPWLDPDARENFVPVVDDDGGIVGYRFRRSPRDSPARLMGISSRYTVVAFDDRPLAGRADIEAMLAALLTRSEVTLSLRSRDGEGEWRVLLTGDPAALPGDGTLPGVRIAETPAERRAALGVTQVEGGFLLPRTVAHQFADEFARIRRPRRDPQGSYRILRSASDGVFGALGLRSGDQVLAYDDTVLGGDQVIEGLVATQRGTKQVVVLVIARRGEEHSITYRITDDDGAPATD